MHIINETYHETTQFTPSEIVLGKKPKRPWKEFFEIPGTQEWSQEEKIKKARGNMHKFLKKRAENKNKNRKHFKFEIGQKVLIKEERKSYAEKNIAAKFLHVFEGPYIIKSIAGKDTYILEDENNIEGETFHLDNLREHFD